MPASIDEYIEPFPPPVRKILTRIRKTVRRAVPDGEETISYGIPTIKIDGRYVVYFAGWKHHISVYPIPGGDAAFERELAPYEAAKGTLKFPLSEPIPYDLIGRVAAKLAAARVR